MKKKTNKNREIGVALASMFALSQIFYSSAFAADQQPPVSGIQWTKVEDLDPNKKSDLKPVGQKFAVVIGVSQFAESRLNPDNPEMEKAAKEFNSYLLDPNGGRFSPKHVRMLNNSKATRENILNTLGSSWLGQLAKPEDLVLVFVSTSSFPTTDGDAYLCSYDCALDNIYGTCVSIKDLMGVLRKNVKAQRIVLVLQSGYSGAAELSAGSKSLTKTFNVDPSKFVSGTGFVIVTSSQPDQMSWGNVFSTNLVSALRQNNGLVSLDEAFEIAKKNTVQATSHGGQYMSKQTPLMKSDFKGKSLYLGVPGSKEADDVPDDVSNFLAAEAIYFKANTLVNEGKVDEAILAYQKTLETDPNYAPALSDYATILALKGKLKESEELYRKAIAQKPQEALYHTNLARVLAKLGGDENKQASRAELRRAYDLNSKDLTVLQALSKSYLQDQEFDKAIDILAEALVLYPKSASVHDQLSFALACAGRLQEALTYAQKSVELDPKLLSAQMNLGSTYMLQGNHSKAKEAYRQAVVMAPKNADAHYCLGQSLVKSGEKEAGKKELQNYLELANPADPKRKRAEEMISSL
ncbi:MAG: tetratricopeptide repeat protein [Cyanobacteria bacterium TGS_CYA1]|nr:tetratricopeptide repeat protein [Cyanobacteria bacterium TGS_CYA1]